MGSCINTENSIHKTDIGFEDLSVWKERQRLPYRDGEHACRRRVIHPLLLFLHAIEEMSVRQTSASAPLFVPGQHHLDGDCRLEGGNPYGNFLAFDCHRAGEEPARSHRSPCLPAHWERVIGKGMIVPLSDFCRIAVIVHSGHAHSMTGPSSGWLILSGTFFFCRNLLYAFLPPFSPARACIGEVPSSASCIGRSSSALHVRLLRLKSSHRRRNDIVADNSSFLAKNAVQAKFEHFEACLCFVIQGRMRKAFTAKTSVLHGGNSSLNAMRCLKTESQRNCSRPVRNRPPFLAYTSVLPKISPYGQKRHLHA